ncbi:enoyl-CoA hydratase [Paraburkholderia fungorum]|uniref:enoyl-CoA hydratase n=1 Tax=Paraburkholderia fungorum TaxID=134537 RepID=UPI0038B72D73
MTTNTTSAGRLAISDSGTTLHIGIDNPARFNAMSLSMWEAMADAVQSAQSRTDLRAIVLEGKGDRAFVSGADISEFAERRSDANGIARYDKAVANAQQALSTSSIPTIALVRGVCMGGGLGLALACDLRYCSESARFRMPAGRLGLGYSLVGVRRMREILGAARTTDLFLSARMFDGLEAGRIGVVHEVFKDTEFAAKSAERVDTVASNAPLTLRAARLALRHLDGDPGVSEQSVDDAVRACFHSEDYREGQAAFREKRKPQFRAR